MTRSLLVCVSLVLCAMGLVGLYYFLLLLGGPYADSQVPTKVYRPIQNVTVGGSVFPLSWEVDDRFVLEVGDDFSISSGTKLDSFPQDWKVEPDTLSYRLSKGTKRYYVAEGVEKFMAVNVDNAGIVVMVDISISVKKDLWFVDNVSMRRICLFDIIDQQLIDFLQSLPRK